MAKRSNSRRGELGPTSLPGARQDVGDLSSVRASEYDAVLPAFVQHGLSVAKAGRLPNPAVERALFKCLSEHLSHSAVVDFLLSKVSGSELTSAALATDILCRHPSQVVDERILDKLRGEGVRPSVRARLTKILASTSHALEATELLHYARTNADHPELRAAALFTLIRDRKQLSAQALSEFVGAVSSDEASVVRRTAMSVLSRLSGGMTAEALATLCLAEKQRDSRWRPSQEVITKLTSERGGLAGSWPIVVDYVRNVAPTTQSPNLEKLYPNIDRLSLLGRIPDSKWMGEHLPNQSDIFVRIRDADPSFMNKIIDWCIGEYAYSELLRMSLHVLHIRLLKVSEAEDEARDLPKILREVSFAKLIDAAESGLVESLEKVAITDFLCVWKGSELTQSDRRRLANVISGVQDEALRGHGERMLAIAEKFGATGERRALGGLSRSAAKFDALSFSRAVFPELPIEDKEAFVDAMQRGIFTYPWAERHAAAVVGFFHAFPVRESVWFDPSIQDALMKSIDISLLNVMSLALLDERSRLAGHISRLYPCSLLSEVPLSEAFSSSSSFRHLVRAHISDAFAIATTKDKGSKAFQRLNNIRIVQERFTSEQFELACESGWFDKRQFDVTGPEWFVPTESSIVLETCGKRLLNPDSTEVERSRAKQTLRTLLKGMYDNYIKKFKHSEVCKDPASASMLIDLALKAPDDTLRLLASYFLGDDIQLLRVNQIQKLIAAASSSESLERYYAERALASTKLGLSRQTQQFFGLAPVAEFLQSRFREERGDEIEQLIMVNNMGIIADREGDEEAFARMFIRRLPAYADILRQDDFNGVLEPTSSGGDDESYKYLLNLVFGDDEKLSEGAALALELCY